MSQIKRLLAILVVFYLIALVFVYVKQRSFIYFPENVSPPEGFVTSLGLEPVGIDVDEVGTITSYFDRPNDGAPLILLFHGNGGSVYHRESMLRDFKEWGAGYLAAEYPGYAGNPGKPTEGTIYSSALAHFDWLVANGVSPDQIIIYGHSLGAASAVHVAAEREAASLVLSAPFLSATAMGRHRMPYFPTSLLLKDKFRSDLKMPKVEEELLVLHGDQDVVIPHEMGKTLASRHLGKAQFITITGARHDMWHMGLKNHVKTVVDRHIAQPTHKH